MNATTVKTTMGGKRILAVIMALVLACGLCPGLAHAAQLEAGQASTPDESLSPQAATKTVYVIASTVNTADWGLVSKVTSKYSYNKNGLVKKRTSKSNMDGNATTTYAYDGTVLKSATETGDTINLKATFTANKKGQFTKAVEVSTQPTGELLTRTYTATYTSDKVTKVTAKNVLESGDEKSTTTDTTTYTYNKKGQMATRTAYGSKVSYGYDAQGNCNSIGGSKYKTAYNTKKLITKKTQSEEGFKYTVTFKYKAIEVKASVADKVAAQQWAIINDNLNFAFGLDV